MRKFIIIAITVASTIFVIKVAPRIGEWHQQYATEQREEEKKEIEAHNQYFPGPWLELKFMCDKAKTSIKVEIITAFTKDETIEKPRLPMEGFDYFVHKCSWENNASSVKTVLAPFCFGEQE